MGRVLFVGDKKKTEYMVQHYKIVKEVPELIENYVVF